MLTPKDYEYLLNDSRARVLVVHESLLGQIAPIRDNLRYLRARDRGRRERPAAAESRRADAASLAVAGAGRHEQGRHGLLAVQFGHHRLAQGGDPPAPRHARRGRSLRAGRPSACRNRTCRSRWPSCSSPTGWATGCTSRLRSAARRCCCPTGPTPEKVFEVIDRYQPTVFYGVPTSYAALLHHGREDRPDEPGPRADVRLGRRDRCPRHIFLTVARAVRRRDPRRHRLHGDPAHLHLQPAGPGARPGSTGQIVPGYEARIVDDDGHDLPAGQVGTLLIKGDSIAAGYWNKHEQTKQTFCGEWINTHDKFMRRRGRLLLVRRPDRRHDQGQRPGRLADRRGRRAAGASGRAGKRRGRRRRRGRADQAGGLSSCSRTATRRRRNWPANCRSSSSTTPPRTSTRARSSSSTHCPRRPPARSSGYELRERAAVDGVLHPQ